MKLEKDLSEVTKPELVQILRLCIGKHCDECPLANEYKFDKDACYRILMVRCIDEFKNDRQKMNKALEYVSDTRRGLEELKESISKTFKVGE